MRQTWRAQLPRAGQSLRVHPPTFFSLALVGSKTETVSKSVRPLIVWKDNDVKKNDDGRLGLLAR